MKWGILGKRYLLKGSGLSTGDVVEIETTLVDELSLRATIADLRNSLVCSVLGLEEHDGGPVVRLVLLEGAGRACGRSQVVSSGVHGDVERVTTDQLVQVRSVRHTGVDQGVDTVDN